MNLKRTIRNVHLEKRARKHSTLLEDATEQWKTFTE